jgi:uncharacterized protein
MSVRLDRDSAPAGPTVNGFVGTGFRVGDTVHASGLMLAPDWARGWAAPRIEDLDEAALADLLALEPAPEFLLLGTGPTMRRPPAAFAAAVEARGVGIEAMDSRAAARAWGVLRGEDRWIVAALLPLG